MTDRCEVCGTTEELKSRRVAHAQVMICSFCWKEYSLPEIVSEVEL